MSRAIDAVDAANAAFDELIRVGKAEPSEREAFQFGFAAGITYATWLLTRRTSLAPTPKQLISFETLLLEEHSG